MDRSIDDVVNLPKDTWIATKYLMEMVLHNIYPLLRSISNKIQLQYKEGTFDENSLMEFREVYILCSSQIKKCVLNLIDVFKQEHLKQLHLQESRQCVLERLACCIEKLNCVKDHLDKPMNTNLSNGNNSLYVTTMYFVNWIDQTFEILNNMSSVVYRTDWEDSQEICDEWKNSVVECVSGLHESIDELLLSAMTLCRYCLPPDQPVVKVRCQVVCEVCHPTLGQHGGLWPQPSQYERRPIFRQWNEKWVLRETKALLMDLIEGDLDGVFHATKDSLKLPIMPSNTNLLIDVLKDVLYVLETNTNTALLALLVHCFSYSLSPVEVLRTHLKLKKNNMCPCNVSCDDVAKSCSYVKDFDLYNERLLQIGSFAISCSSDQKRVLSLRSGLASLEALDPHLVPAVMLSPDSTHSNLLIESWNREVLEIKKNVFLIVDPTAFTERAKQMMHQTLLEIIKENSYHNNAVCSVINMGCTVHQLFSVYDECEPAALPQRALLLPLLRDLHKVQSECKVVSDMLSAGDDFVYDVKTSKSTREVTFAQVLKRLKLLFTIVTKIHVVVSPVENDQHFYEDDTVVDNKHITHTLHGRTGRSPRPPLATISRSVFSRDANIRSSTAKAPLGVLTKHLQVKRLRDLSFSVKLDEMCTSECPPSLRSTSILYHSTGRNRSSLRRAVLKRRGLAALQDQHVAPAEDRGPELGAAGQESLLDAATSLQITEVLNEINNLTNFSLVKRDINTTRCVNQGTYSEAASGRSNVLRLAVNSEPTVKFNHVWNISVSSSESAVLHSSQRSEVTSLERINDLETLDNKLKKLKTLQTETSL